MRGVSSPEGRRYDHGVHAVPTVGARSALGLLRYTCFGLKYLFTKAGFVDISVKSTTGFWSMWLLDLNYQTTRLIRGGICRRRATRATLIPLWWTSQSTAPWLDRWCPDERETAGYFTTARKP